MDTNVGISIVIWINQSKKYSSSYIVLINNPNFGEKPAHGKLFIEELYKKKNKEFCVLECVMISQLHQSGYSSSKLRTNRKYTGKTTFHKSDLSVHALWTRNKS